MFFFSKGDLNTCSGVYSKGTEYVYQISLVRQPLRNQNSLNERSEEPGSILSGGIQSDEFTGHFDSQCSWLLIYNSLAGRGLSIQALSTFNYKISQYYHLSLHTLRILPKTCTS